MKTKTKKPLKLHIKKGDEVIILAGKEKGKTGTVKEVFAETQRATVEGLNLVTKHVKPSATNPEGGVIQKEAALHISNIAHVHTDAEGNKVGTRIGRRLNAETNKLERYSKKSGETLD